MNGRGLEPEVGVALKIFQAHSCTPYYRTPLLQILYLPLLPASSVTHNILTYMYISSFLTSIMVWDPCMYTNIHSIVFASLGFTYIHIYYCVHIPWPPYCILHQPRLIGLLVVLSDYLTHLVVTKHIHDHIYEWVTVRHSGDNMIEGLEFVGITICRTVTCT